MLLFFRVFFLIGLLGWGPSVQASEPLNLCRGIKRYHRLAAKDSCWKEIRAMPGLQIQIRYASTDNWTHIDFYCGQKKAFLRQEAAAALLRAVRLLKKQYPRYSLLLWDAARCREAQEFMRRRVRHTSLSHFVSSPWPGSVHTFGMAVDVSLVDSNGIAVDMGTDYDDFSEKATAREALEDHLVEEGVLTAQQVGHRRMLRKIMRQAGFIALPSEWWHFNAAPSRYVRDSLPWEPGATQTLHEMQQASP